MPPLYSVEINSVSSEFSAAKYNRSFLIFRFCEIPSTKRSYSSFLRYQIATTYPTGLLQGRSFHKLTSFISSRLHFITWQRFEYNRSKNHWRLEKSEFWTTEGLSAYKSSLREWREDIGWRLSALFQVRRILASRWSNGNDQGILSLQEWNRVSKILVYTIPIICQFQINSEIDEMTFWIDLPKATEITHLDLS